MKRYIGHLLIPDTPINKCPYCDDLLEKIKVTIPVSKYSPFDIHYLWRDITVDAVYCCRCSNKFFLYEATLSKVKEKYLQNNRSLRLTHINVAQILNGQFIYEVRKKLPEFHHGVKLPDYSNRKCYDKKSGDKIFYDDTGDITLTDLNGRLVASGKRKNKKRPNYYNGYVRLFYENHKPYYIGQIVDGYLQDDNAVICDLNGTKFKGRVINGIPDNPKDHCWYCKGPIHTDMTYCNECGGYHCEKCGECLCNFWRTSY